MRQLWRPNNFRSGVRVRLWPGGLLPRMRRRTSGAIYENDFAGCLKTSGRASLKETRPEIESKVIRVSEFYNNFALMAAMLLKTAIYTGLGLGCLFVYAVGRWARARRVPAHKQFETSLRQEKQRLHVLVFPTQPQAQPVRYRR